ncbi:MAG: NosD domain-containing protein [Methanobacteriota archaeon]
MNLFNVTYTTIINEHLQEILIQKSTYITIQNTTLLGRGIIFYDYETRLKNWNTHTIVDNIVRSKPLYYYKNTNFLTVPRNAGQVILANCSYMVIQNLVLENSSHGIQLAFSAYNIIRNNSIRGIGNWHIDSVGINLINSSNNVIYGNIINATITGIDITKASYNLIRQNTIVQNSVGLSLGQSEWNMISQNMFSENWDGIILYDSTNTTIRENTILNNYDVGINVYSGHPLFIYHNNLINNSLNAYNFGTYIWDNGYPCGGNYWSDNWWVIDENHGPGQNISGPDGIDDNPYNFISGIDRYPFIQVNGWDKPPNSPSNPHPVNGSSRVNVYTNLTWSGGDPYGDPVKYFVYLGTHPSMLRLVNITLECCYDPPNRLLGTTLYYWQIIALDDHNHEVAGPIWHFKTALEYEQIVPN